jgi:transcriptional regulator with XRE-family HTH domain
MGLVELGRHTGLSPAMLSKIERGQLFLTLPTLLRIALVFSVGLDFFFSGGEEHRLEARDSMYFDSNTPHGYRRTGAKTCSAIVVTTA